MIKANELRIGNYLYFLYENNEGVITKKATWIISDHISNISKMDDADDFFEYIPLTPEILEKCGLKLGYGDRWYLETSDVNILEFDGIDEEGILQPYMYYTGANISDQAKPKYLHQFQNLIFALTGEELTINL
jgi:hypothetical protein